MKTTVLLLFDSEANVVFQSNKIEHYSVVKQITIYLKMFSVCAALLIKIFEELESKD